jgi:two-component system copper resistance phosphate regulon response regulator CusR
MRILVVEDEPKTASFLGSGLRESGFGVDVAADGRTGWSLARERDYGLVILNILLPGIDGWSLLRGLRGSGKQMPVMFLSGRDDVEDRVRGLEAGADDFLVKPFAFSELLARVRALLRRPAARSTDVLAIADLEVDLPRQRAARAGVRLDLTSQEFSLLSLLLRHRGEVLSRSYIAEQVWDANFRSDANVVDVAIRRLRRKLDIPFPEKLIHTVRGAGYELERRPRILGFSTVSERLDCRAKANPSSNGSGDWLSNRRTEQ